MNQKQNWSSFGTGLNTHYPLLCIITGSALVLFTTGPFYNWDTTMEFQAARGVIDWGKPYYQPNYLLNQPPIGFYIDALFFKSFNIYASQQSAVNITTLFGLGCIFLLYKLGETVYGQKTGVIAAALFALSPWQVIMSRSFLIDAQCLFFSLLYLLVGVWAIQRDTRRLFLVASLFFGIALLTKAFAVFMLIPLGLFYGYAHQKKLGSILAATFFLPASLFVVLWYQFLSGLNDIQKFFLHEDFFTYNDVFVPSVCFVGNFLLTMLGVFFLAAVAISASLACIHKKSFPKLFRFDVICIATVAAIAGINTLLAVNFNLKVPYVNPIKYDFQLLPFLCLLAASLAPKCSVLFGSLKSRRKRDLFFFGVVCLGILGLGLSLWTYMLDITSFSTLNF
jgi:4-amino-4-deoxy-L-arabinose transferase-like glycosyltransferase